MIFVFTRCRGVNPIRGFFIWQGRHLTIFEISWQRQDLIKAAGHRNEKMVDAIRFWGQLVCVLWRGRVQATDTCLVLSLFLSDKIRIHKWIQNLVFEMQQDFICCCHALLTGILRDDTVLSSHPSICSSNQILTAVSCNCYRVFVWSVFDMSAFR